VRFLQQYFNLFKHLYQFRANTLSPFNVINFLIKMLHKYLRIFIPAAIGYAILIFYLSITSNIGGIRHVVNLTLVHGIKEFLIAIRVPFILSFLVNSLNFVESLSIDIGHVGIYFVFGILLYFAFLSSKKKVFERSPAAFAVCIGTAYGIINEFFQLSLPYRTASVGDALSNLLGLVLAQLLVIFFVFVFKQVQKMKEQKGSVI
jgi:VanZ family protein